MVIKGVKFIIIITSNLIFNLSRLIVRVRNPVQTDLAPIGLHMSDLIIQWERLLRLAYTRAAPTVRAHQ